MGSSMPLRPIFLSWLLLKRSRSGLFLFLSLITATVASSSSIMGSSSSAKKAPSCVLDKTILNEKTVTHLDDMGLSIFAVACSKNRGAFIVPHVHHTFSCLELPESFGKAAGLKNATMIATANDIKEKLADGNLTASQAVDILGMLNSAVYNSTAHVDQDPYSCSLSGLSKLECKTKSLTKDTIRAATVAGVFAPAPWVTGGKELTAKQAKNFYTSHDFDDMASLGLNTVVIPIDIGIFVSHKKHHDELSLLKDMLSMVKKSKLEAILQLVDVNDDDEKDLKYGVEEAVEFAKKEERTVLAVQLPASNGGEPYNMVSVARKISKKLPLLVPVNGGSLQHLEHHLPEDDEYLYAAFSMDHTSTVADIASSSSVDDRMKMFYHESTACIARSPIEYAACYKDTPMFISSGFDISIDNCVLQGTDKFHDYGQCDRFKETVGSPWWERHRQSFAARQLFAFEQGLGWTYTAWKLYGDGSNDKEEIIDSPAKLLSLKNVAMAGLFPSLGEMDKYDSSTLVCLNPPVADFTLGDATLAPTPGPPPDCGNGWWNETIQDCTYWVPPPPPPPCPVCECANAPTAVEPNATTSAAEPNATTSVAEPNATTTLSNTTETPDVGGNATTGIPAATDQATTNQVMALDFGAGSAAIPSSGHLTLAFGTGALVAMLVGAIVGRWSKNRRNGYTIIPN